MSTETGIVPNTRGKNNKHSKERPVRKQTYPTSEEINMPVAYISCQYLFYS